MFHQIGFILLAVIYFLVHGPAVYAQETSFWVQRRQRMTERNPTPSILAVPPINGTLSNCLGDGVDLVSPSTRENVPGSVFQTHRDLLSVLARAPGTVRKISVPSRVYPSTPLVIHIQDVHGNEQAQRRIGESIESLVSHGLVNAVGLEGASGPLSIQKFRDFQNREAVRRAADYLLGEQKISGPIHAALTGNGPWPLTTGIEDPTLYWANVAAYRAAAPAQEKTRARLVWERTRIENQKKAVYSPALLAFDQSVQAYADRRLSLGDFVNTLPAATGFPTLARFRETVALEKGLNFSKVEAERLRLIFEMERRLAGPEMDSLVSDAEAFRAGRLRAGAFYGRLKSRAERLGLLKSEMSNLSAYFRYVERADGIDAERLMEELAAAEKDGYARLVKTDDQRRLVERARRLSLAERLADFLLTPSEWEEYQAIPKERRPPFLKNFESFYQHAQARDQSMSAQVMSLLKKGGERPLVLVTGGFHARGMAERLTRAGVTVVSFVPKIESVEIDKGSVSLGLFTQEKTPLEKMVQKERLFLAAHPVSPTVLKTLFPALVAAVVLYGGGAAAGVDVQVLYQTLGGVGLLAVGKLLGDLVELKVIKKRGSASLRVSIKPDGTITNLSEQSDQGINPLERIKKRWATIQMSLPQFDVSPILAMASDSKSPHSVSPTISGALPSSRAPLRVENSLPAVPPDLQELHNLVRKYLLEIASVNGKSKGPAYVDPIREIVRKVGEMSPALRMFYENELIDDSFDTPQLMDLLVRALFIPAGFCISRDLNQHELLRINSVTRSEYLGREIWLADVSKLDGTPTGSLNPALNVPAGYILVDTSSLGPVVEEVLKRNKELHLTRDELLRVELEFSIQTYLAKAAQESFISKRQDLPMHAVSGLTIVPAIVRPGGRADSYLRESVKKTQKGDPGSVFIPSAFVELFVFSNRLEGMINALENLAQTLGEEKAHEIGIFKLMEVAEHGDLKAPRGMSLLSRPAAFGAKVFIDQIMSAVVEARKSRRASLQPSLWKQHLKKELTSETLKSFPALIELLKKIQRDNFLTPFERFIEVTGYPPAPSDVYPHMGTIPIRESSVREVGSPFVVRRRRGGPPSLLLKKLMTNVRQRVEGSNDRQPEEVGQLIRDLGNVLAKENELGLAELLALLEGPLGLRNRVIQNAHIEEVVELSMLIEHLRETIADREAIEKLSEGQALMEKAEFEPAILSFLEIYKDENLTGNMSEEVNSNLKGLLESARALFISSNQQPVLNRVEVIDKSDLFGLGQDEVEFLKRLSNSAGEINLEPLPFDAWGLSQLRNKLGKHTPTVLSQLSEGLTGQNDASPDSQRSPVILAGEFDVLVDKDMDSNLKKTQLGNALVRIEDLIQKAVSRRGGKSDKLDFSFAKAYLGHEYPDVLRDRLSGSLRVYFRVFEESDGNIKKNVVVVAALVNKGNTSEDGGLGAIDAQLGEKLRGYSHIGNLGSEALRNKTEPLTVKPKASPASLADGWAWKKWGGDPHGYDPYILYTFFGAPAWEWVYQVLPLNLWAQRGGANWILRRFFGKEDNNPVVQGVPGQAAVTLLGVGLLGIGLWAGTWLWVLLGAMSYSYASASVFSGAHPDKTPEERRFLFRLGFGLALAFIGPSLGLFLWDPIWLTGFGTLYFLGSMGVGWILSYAGHLGAQWISLQMKAKTNSYPNPEFVLNGNDLWGKLLAIEESVAVGDLGKAHEIWVGVREGVEPISPVTLEGQWIASVQQRLSDATELPATTEPNSVALCFKEMEYDFFEARDFVALFRIREIIQDFELTEGQRDLLRNWDEIIHVVRLFTTGQWEEADRQVAYLETTARLFVRDHGIFQPYRERLLFGFLRDFRFQREISRAPGVQQTLTELSELKGKPINDLGRIIHQMARLNDVLNDYEKAALNVHAEHLKTIGPVVLVLRLPEFVFGIERPGLTVYKPLLMQAMNLIPDGAMLNDFSEAIQRYIGNQQRMDFVGDLTKMGVSLSDGLVLSEFLSPESTRDFGHGDFPGMHAVGGTMGKKERDSLASRAGAEANLARRQTWASAIETSLARRERERILERVGLSQPLRELITLLRMPSPSIDVFGAKTPVRFQLLPGDWDPWSPAPRAGIYYVKEEPNSGGVESLACVVVLHENDLAAVLHEGVELLLTYRPNARYHHGPAHPYGFLSEILANDPAFGDEVPQRAYQELGRMSFEQLGIFLSKSSKNKLEIGGKFSGKSLTAMRNHLLKINETLVAFARGMQHERTADSLGSLTADLVEMEKFIAVGNVSQAVESKERAVRRLYHLQKKSLRKIRFQETVLNDLTQRLATMTYRSKQMSSLNLSKNRDLSERLERMPAELFGFDVVGLSDSIIRLQIFKNDENFSEQTAAMELWWGIWSVLKPVIENDDWAQADIKFARFERKMRQNWKIWGVGRMYLESLGFGFIDRYRSQRDAVLQRRMPHPFQGAREKLRNAAQQTSILTQEEVAELGRALISAMGESLNQFQRESLRFSVARLGSRITDETREKWSQLIKRENGLQNVTRDAASPHEPYLYNMLLMSPGSEMKIPGLNSLGVHYRQLTMTRHNVIFFLWRNGINILSSDEWIAFMDELRGPPVSEKANGMLNRIFSKQAGHALVEIHVALFTALAAVMVGAVFFNGWMWLAVAASGVVAGGLAGRVLGKGHPLDLDVAGKRLVADFGQVRWELAAQQADVMAGNVGARPLTILYLDKTMILSWENKAALIQRYSASGDGADLALVPVDEAAQSYVNDLPDNYNCLVFESGRDLFGRWRTGAPSLAEVERRLGKAGVRFSDYTGCRVVAPVGMALDAEGVRSDLFKEALVILLNGVIGLVIKRKDLHSIDRATRAIISAA